MVEGLADFQGSRGVSVFTARRNFTQSGNGRTEMGWAGLQNVSMRREWGDGVFRP